MNQMTGVAAVRALMSVVVFSIVMVGASALASANGFVPFTKVQDVCPTCSKRATDVIALNNGQKVRAKVVSENADFFVLARFGEVRVLPKTQMTSIEWANKSAPMGLTSQDQILLKNGHVFTGSIVEQKDAPVGYYRLRSSLNEQTFIVFAAEVQAVYKGGQKQ